VFPAAHQHGAGGGLEEAPVVDSHGEGGVGEGADLYRRALDAEGTEQAGEEGEVGV
jgi:hypothetical protein